MNAKRGKTLLSDMRHVSELMRKEHARMDDEQLADFKPHDLARRVLARLDPGDRTPLDVRLCAHAMLVHMAAALCANVHRTAEEMTTAQGVRFNMGLQPRYPVEVDGETFYRKCDLMTVGQLRVNAERLRREGQAKTAHAAALDAETDDKLARGYFDDEGVPLVASKHE
ncbi:hypothetical protein [Caballeronia zhejiangensis]|uniref:Uncharacterized protein n=1 Tax=Caballeronia zhejiangensis TaxID=871203 RepID=A0A656QNL3_9BURK|nr:hypothetical protein [Caballeronia zhejiangensis]KDR31767.1 hypothetical protein BG60_28995 [Caballeronia zhejiangensis]